MPVGIITVKVVPLAENALRPHRAAMQLDEFLHERESDSGPLHRAALLALDAMEALEKPRKLGLGDAHPGVTGRLALPRALRPEAPPRLLRRTCT